MLTQVTDTSIDSFHAHTGSGKAVAQRKYILDFIARRGGDWSIGEIANALYMEKSTVSARLNELLKSGCVIEKPKRRDRVSGVLVRPVALPAKQWELI